MRLVGHEAELAAALGREPRRGDAREESCFVGQSGVAPVREGLDVWRGASDGAGVRVGGVIVKEVTFAGEHSWTTASNDRRQRAAELVGLLPPLGLPRSRALHPMFTAPPS